MMRSLVRNQRPFYYATVVGTEPIFDEYGNDTLETQTIWSEPVLSKANISPNVGEEVVEVFGAHTEYSRTISMTKCPFSVGDKIWFGVEPPNENNYTVAKIADSKNGFLVALREVSPRG